MSGPVRIRFRHDTVTENGGHYIKDAEFDVTSADAAHKLYGDAVEILHYSDGSPYELSLKAQAAERKDETADPEKAKGK